MREYTALHYVRDNEGVLHTPGEIFQTEYEGAVEERLLRLGAVKPCGEAAYVEKEPQEYIEPVFEDIPDAQEEAEPPIIDVMEGISSTPKRGRRK